MVPGFWWRHHNAEEKIFADSSFQSLHYFLTMATPPKVHLHGHIANAKLISSKFELLVIKGDRSPIQHVVCKMSDELVPDVGDFAGLLFGKILRVGNPVFVLIWFNRNGARILIHDKVVDPFFIDPNCIIGEKVLLSMSKMQAPGSNQPDEPNALLV